MNHTHPVFKIRFQIARARVAILSREKEKTRQGNGNKLSVPFPESNDSDEWRVRVIMPLGVNCEARPPSELQRANGRRGQLVLAQ